RRHTRFSRDWSSDVCSSDLTRSGRGLVEQGWDESTIANLAQVEQILANYYPNGDGPGGYRLVGNDDRKAAGVQAAIWHFTDGFRSEERRVGKERRRRGRPPQ